MVGLIIMGIVIAAMVIVAIAAYHWPTRGQVNEGQFRPDPVSGADARTARNARLDNPPAAG
jgi:hypothetical protein